MKINTLDHVALWVADRDRLSDFLTRHVGMHVIDRTDRAAPVDAEEVGDAFDEAPGTSPLLITGRRASGNDAAL